MILLDGLQIQGAILIGQGDGLAFRSGPGGAADTVDVVLAILGQVVIDDMGDAVDVQTARGDIGGNQDRQFAFLEILQYAQPFLLLHIPGDQPAGKIVGVQPIIADIPLRAWY